ncbi:hypothetical protein NDU88_003457 [Pleurodeles waltl]|uniref:Uncharacterized protein n=1 Tax=Pleurodeles waltl TaxID=8319 RepID=A0AAV7V2F6_PLEWA|nr:hypothetical protein NDU88_003457 [Pleurodeles waltl]
MAARRPREEPAGRPGVNAAASSEHIFEKCGRGPRGLRDGRGAEARGSCAATASRPCIGMSVPTLRGKGEERRARAAGEARARSLAATAASFQQRLRYCGMDPRVSPQGDRAGGVQQCTASN